MKLEKVTIVGGTHGNEYTGPYLLKFLKEKNLLTKFSTFETNLFLANPKAYEKNVRFLDVDLNRSFSQEDLSNSSLGHYEADRAKVIHQLLGPKSNPKTDFILDVHTTTANMGVTLIIVDNNPFNLEMAAFVKSKIPGVSILYNPMAEQAGREGLPFLNSLTEHSIGIELGPIANGIVRQDVLLQACDSTLACLEYIEMVNNETEIPVGNEIEVFEKVKPVSFPLDSHGNIAAIVHEYLQDRDFKPLHKNHPVFLKLDGEVVLNQEEETYFPIFINEAATYYLSIAYSLTRKRLLKIRK